MFFSNSFQIDSKLQPAAVLIPIFHNEEPHLLFTKRNQNVRHHKGEICFPGGKYDPIYDKHLMDTALRETTEETGIQQEDVKVLGTLSSVVTPTAYQIFPFIGYISHPYSFSINQSEVEELIEVPLSFFQKNKNSNRTSHNVEANSRPYLFQWKEHAIWGATAKIVLHLIDELEKLQLPFSEKNTFILGDSSIPVKPDFFNH